MDNVRQLRLERSRGLINLDKLKIKNAGVKNTAI